MNYENMTYAQLMNEAKLRGLRFVCAPKRASLIVILADEGAAEDDS